MSRRPSPHWHHVVPANGVATCALAAAFLTSNLAGAQQKYRPPPDAVIRHAAFNGHSIILGGSFYQWARFGRRDYRATGSGSDAFLVEWKASGQVGWVRVFGTARSAEVRSVAAAPNGDVIAGGWLACRTGKVVENIDHAGGRCQPTNFGAGPTDPVSTWRDGFVARYDARGRHLWSRRFGPTDSTIESSATVDHIAVDASGDVLIDGSFRGTGFDLGTGVLEHTEPPVCGEPMLGSPPRHEPCKWPASLDEHDLYVAKLRGSDGATMWSQRFYGGAYNGMGPLATGPAGELFTSLIFLGKGWPGQPPGDPTERGAVVMRLDPNSGEIIWTLPLRGTINVGSGVLTDSIVAGGASLFVAGVHGGALEIGGARMPRAGGFVASIAASDGALQWTQSFSGVSRESGRTWLTQVASGALVLGVEPHVAFDATSGIQIESSSHDEGTWVVVLSPADGTPRSAVELGQPRNRPSVCAMGQTPEGKLWWAGGTFGTYARWSVGWTPHVVP